MKNRSLMFDTNIIYFILIACFVAIRVISGLFSFSGTVASILNILLQIVIMFGIPFVLYKIFRKCSTKQMLSDFKFNKISFKAILISVGIGILVYIINIAVASFFNSIIIALGYDPYFGFTGSTSSSPISFITFLLNVFMTAILPGFCEEFAHRGLLLNGYKNYGAKKAILLSGLLFGLMHLNIEQCFYASIIGFFLGFIAIITNSIFPCMIIHFMNNFISVFLTYAESNGLFGNTLSGWLTGLLSGNSVFLTLFIIFIVICILLAVLAFLVYRLLKETKIKNIANFADTLFKQKLRADLMGNLIENDKENQPAQKDQVEIDINNANMLAPSGKILLPQNLIFSGFVKQKVSFKDEIFMYGTLFIGIITNISTLIWGML